MARLSQVNLMIKTIGCLSFLKKSQHLTNSFSFFNFVTSSVATIMMIAVTCSNKCGNGLSQVACTCIERRTRVDIFFEETVEHVDA